jgi:hypothetical protein
MVETLFFKTYHAFLLGKLTDTQMYFEFLAEEFKRKKNAEALKRKQLLILKKIRSALETGKIENQQWINEPAMPSISTDLAPGIKQPELVRKIHYEGLASLQEHLEAPGLELYNIEHPCGEYGAVDMVYKSEGIIYPVEVKRHEGKHDLIGQINKYTLYFNLNLHLKHYEDVQPITICNSYNPHTLAELKRLSVIPLKYDLTDEGIKIRKI